MVSSECRTASQDSCSVSISSLRSDLWSSDSFSTHAALSNLMGTVAGAVGELAGLEGLVDDDGPLVFGAPKNDVMEALAFGFLTASAATSTALRLSDMRLCGVQWACCD